MGAIVVIILLVAVSAGSGARKKVIRTPSNESPITGIFDESPDSPSSWLAIDPLSGIERPKSTLSIDGSFSPKITAGSLQSRGRGEGTLADSPLSSTSMIDLSGIHDSELNPFGNRSHVPGFLGAFSIGRRRRTTSSRAQFGVATAIAALGLTHGQDRLNVLSAIRPSLPNNLTGDDVAGLLGSLFGSYRVEGIELLSHKIRSKLSEDEMTAILGNLFADDRARAVKALYRLSR